MKHYTIHLTEDEMSAVKFALDTLAKDKPNYMLIGEIKAVAKYVTDMLNEIDEETDDGR